MQKNSKCLDLGLHGLRNAVEKPQFYLFFEEVHILSI